MSGLGNDWLPPMFSRVMPTAQHWSELAHVEPMRTSSEPVPGTVLTYQPDGAACAGCVETIRDPAKQRRDGEDDAPEGGETASNERDSSWLSLRPFHRHHGCTQSIASKGWSVASRWTG